MTIWIEQLSGHYAVQIRTRFEQLPVRLGRSYASDFIVEDASAAPEHLTIAIDPNGGLLASTVGEVTFEILDDPQARQKASIDGNTVIRIGKTLLRVRSEADVLELPECKTAPAGKAVSKYLRPGLFFPILPILLGIALFALCNWLADTEASGFTHYFVDRLALLYGIVPWVGHWALLSNAFAGDSRISRHLLITGLGLSALALVKLALPLLSSGLAVGLTGWFDLPLSALVIGATLMAHIAEVANGRRILPAVALSMFAICIAIGAGWYQDRQKAQLHARTPMPGLSPAKVRLAAIQDRAEVLTQLGKIETLAAEELKAPLPDELR